MEAKECNCICKDCEQGKLYQRWIDQCFYSVDNKCEGFDMNYMAIPPKPGIYLIVSTTEEGEYLVRTIEYIGSSYNLQKRHRFHPVISRLKKIRYEVEFYFKPCNDYALQEIEMIKQFQPPFNRTHNPSFNIYDCN